MGVGVGLGCGGVPMKIRLTWWRSIYERLLVNG
jgi:hypothetical protein